MHENEIKYCSSQCCLFERNKNILLIYFVFNPPNLYYHAPLTLYTTVFFTFLLFIISNIVHCFYAIIYSFRLQYFLSVRTRFFSTILEKRAQGFGISV